MQQHWQPCRRLRLTDASTAVHWSGNCNNHPDTTMSANPDTSISSSCACVRPAAKNQQHQCGASSSTNAASSWIIAFVWSYYFVLRRIYRFEGCGACTTGSNAAQGSVDCTDNFGRRLHEQIDWFTKQAGSSRFDKIHLTGDFKSNISIVVCTDNVALLPRGEPLLYG